MAKIPFDIKYRPQIESGEYKVVTKDNKHVRIISWDMHTSSGDKIVALVTGQGGQFEKNRTYLLDGRCCSSQHDSTSLYILTDSVDLTEFEKAYLKVVHHFSEDDVLPHSLACNKVRENAQKLLDVARKQLQPEIDADIEKAYMRGKEDALKDMPHWNYIEAGCAGNGDILPVYLTKDRHGCYALTTAVVGGDDYLVLSELDKLPKNYEQIQLS